MTKVNRISVVLVAAFAAATLLSCNKEEIVTPGKTPIGFHCNDVWTKALISNADEMKEKGFHVYAHGVFDGSGEAYQFDRHVTYNTTENVWDYTNHEYWLPTCTYTFRAYYPATINDRVNETSASEFSIQGFEIDQNYGEQQDLLMASATRKTSEINSLGTTIPLTFNHLLSNLNLTLKVNQIERTVVETDEQGNSTTKTEVVNALDANIMAVYFSNVAQKANYNGSWSGHSGSTSVGSSLPNSIAVTPTGVTFFNDGLLAIPQTISGGDVSLYILADITMPDGTHMQKNWNLLLPATTWEPNKIYHYTATLTAEFNIEFEEPKVEDWVKEQMYGTVIIR